jgi:hypothetical protein
MCLLRQDDLRRSHATPVRRGARDKFPVRATLNSKALPLASLTLAGAMYTGDFVEEDANDDWAIGLREETRAAYTEVARALAEEA